MCSSVGMSASIVMWGGDGVCRRDKARDESRVCTASTPLFYFCKTLSFADASIPALFTTDSFSSTQ